MYFCAPHLPEHYPTDGVGSPDGVIGATLRHCASVSSEEGLHHFFSSFLLFFVELIEGEWVGGAVTHSAGLLPMYVAALVQAIRSYAQCVADDEMKCLRRLPVPRDAERCGGGSGRMDNAFDVARALELYVVHGVVQRLGAIGLVTVAFNVCAALLTVENLLAPGALFPIVDATFCAAQFIPGYRDALEPHGSPGLKAVLGLSTIVRDDSSSVLSAAEPVLSVEEIRAALMAKDSKSLQRLTVEDVRLCATASFLREGPQRVVELLKPLTEMPECNVDLKDLAKRLATLASELDVR
jgi:hypothetical protein